MSGTAGLLGLHPRPAGRGATARGDLPSGGRAVASQAAPAAPGRGGLSAPFVLAQTRGPERLQQHLRSFANLAA